MKKKIVRTMADKILDSLLQQESNLISIKLNLEQTNKILLFQTKLMIQQLQLGTIEGKFYSEAIIDKWYHDMNLL